MVHLQVLPAKGNSATRCFPHSGYLGLSPLKVEGVVKTVLDEDGKELRARALTVAVTCYEARLGKSGIVRTNTLVEHSQTLWSKRADVDWDPLGQADFPFKLVLGPDVPGHSSLVLPDYRIIWKLHAVVHHIPQFGVGDKLAKSFDLRLTRYDAPLPPPLPKPVHLSSPSAGRLPFQYTFSVPSGAFGPTDIVPVELSLLPAEPSLRVHAVTLQLQRHVVLSEAAPSQLPSALTLTPSTPNTPPPSAPASANGYFSPGAVDTDNAGIADSTASFASYDSHAPILGGNNNNRTPGSDSPPPRAVVTPLATIQSPLSPSPDGSCKKTIALALPEPKSSGHWANGFTVNTPLVSIRFYLRAQITLSSQQHPSQQVVELDGHELFLVSTNSSERSVAASKVEQLVILNARHQSKSPASTRSRRRKDEGEPAKGVGRVPTAKSSKSRRPHTSGGTREGPPSRGSFQSLPPAPPSPLSNPYVNGTAAAVRPAPLTTGSLNVTHTTVTHPPSQFSDLVLDWEEELERIASQSRCRTAEMMKTDAKSNPMRYPNAAAAVRRASNVDVRLSAHRASHVPAAAPVKAAS